MTPEFQLPRQTPSLGEKYVEGKKERTIMLSLVATTSTPARKPFVRTHYVRTNNAKFSGHYVLQPTHSALINYESTIAC